MDQRISMDPDTVYDIPFSGESVGKVVTHLVRVPDKVNKDNWKSYLCVDGMTVVRVRYCDIMQRKSKKTLLRLLHSNRLSVRDAAMVELARRSLARRKENV